jgi:polysaccharide biosynthesis protein PslH
MSRPKLLFLSPVSPRFGASGDRIRAALHVSVLAKFFDIDLVVLNTVQSIERDIICSEVSQKCQRVLTIAADSNFFSKLYNLLPHAQFRALARALHPRPIATALYKCRCPELDDFVRGRSYDVVHAFKLKTALLVPHITTNLGRPVERLILDLDDIESEFARRQAIASRRQSGLQMHLMNLLEAYKFKRLERKASRIFDDIYVCSALDRSKFHRIHPPLADVVVVPNVVRHSRLGKMEDAGASAERRVTFLFVGSLQYPPNVDALYFFRDSILPHLRARATVPFEIRIVGRSPGPKVMALAEEPDFSLVADAEDLAPHYHDAAIIIVPLRFGGGTRIKILEAFSYRRAVVSTTIGAEGIEAEHGKNVLIADDPVKFAELCIGLLNSHDYRRQVADAGHKLFEDKYSEAALEKIFEARFGNLLSRERV